MAKIALLGLGTVGSGVAELLDKNSEAIAERAGQPVTIKYILTRRDRPDSPWRDKLIQDFSVVESDPEITLVIECMGGITTALDCVRRALSAGKHVVTANKELIAEYGSELLALAREKGVNLLFEASVGGGVPILRPLVTCLAANRLTEVCGIINGTTNFILTKMRQDNLSYDQALAQAAALGYAEADPSADVDGHDAARKICILAALAFGRHIYPRQTPTLGISGVTREDIAFAEALGCRIKLLGRARQREDGRVCIYVCPHLIPEGMLLAQVEDVFNAIVVRGNGIGEVLFYGRGAGKLPTASAVLADVIDAMQHPAGRSAVNWSEGGEAVVADVRDEAMDWYVRTDAALEQARAILGPGEAIPAQVSGETGLVLRSRTWNDIQSMQSKGFAIRSLFPIWNG